MKIGFITDSIKKDNTGIGNYSKNLLIELMKMKQDIYSIDYESKDLNSGLKEIIIPNRFILLKSVLWHVFLFKNLNEKVDAVLNPSLFPNIFGKFQNLFYVVHDLTPLLFPKEHRFGKNIIFKWLLPITLRKSKKIIAISNNTKKDLMKHFQIPDKKIIVTKLAADKKYKVLPSRKVRLIKKKHSIDFPYILYVGTLEPRKNILRLIEAYSTIEHEIIQKLVIVGKKGWKYRTIFSLIKRLNLSDKVIFTGYIDKEDLPAIYNGADLFVYPSLYEGFGLPPLEAMQCGCPVITSNVSSLPEVVGNAGIMVNPLSVRDISRNIKLVLDNPNISNKLRDKGLRRCKMFSWDKCAKETLEVFENIYDK